MKRYTDYTPNIPTDTGTTKEEVISLDPNENRKRTGANTSGTSKKIAAAKRKSKKSAEQIIDSTPKMFRTSTYRDWAAGTTVRLITGIILGCIAVYLTAAFVSYFTNCIIDQSSITSVGMTQSGKVANAGGEGGARISNFLINDTFGLGSIVILFWLFAMAFKMFEPRLKFKTVNFTIKCIVALISISLIIGLLTISFDSHINWGGLHGRYVNEFIFQFFGLPGAIILCIMVTGIFIVLCLSDIVKWIMRLRREKALRKAKAEAAKKAQQEKARRIAEMKAKEKEEAMRAGEEAIPDNDEPEDENAVTFTEVDSAIVSELPEVDNYIYSEIDDDKAPDNADSEITTTDETQRATGITEASVDESLGNNTDETDVLPMEVHRNLIGEADAIAPEEKYSDATFPYQFPPYDLLEDRGTIEEIDEEEQKENQEKIRTTLANFGIGIKKIHATVGPTVTLYEIVPESGVKISKIRSLVDDIALSLSAIGVRIIAPIPGKGTVGIEVANKVPQVVSMRTVIKSKAFRQSHYKLPFALGSTIGGDVFIGDLAKMPHLLVAGATGQGKSVGLNAIITSLLYCRRPDELKFVMIDPKMVEFSLYSKIEKHYLAKLPDEEDPIITDVRKAAETLNSLCEEMDERYLLLKSAAARNIEEYNAKFNNHKLNPENGHKFLPYIVIIVDEFSDLIMQVGKEVETPIARLAQKARAVGMHVIIATQRPSTNVITGIIKGNFPARIAFKVSSGVDSKTILDTTGAQQLIGRGDLLISCNSDIQRVQCAFIDTPEVEDVCQYIEKQPYAQGPYILPEPKVSVDDDSSSRGGQGLGDRDPLFEEVARLVVTSNSASTSSLQRRYSIGYNRAGKIMDQLEAYGIVGPAQGGKPRTVLMDAMSLESLLNTL